MKHSEMIQWTSNEMPKLWIATDVIQKILRADVYLEVNCEITSKTCSKNSSVFMLKTNKPLSLNVRCKDFLWTHKLTKINRFRHYNVYLDRIHFLKREIPKIIIVSAPFFMNTFPDSLTIN